MQRSVILTGDGSHSVSVPEINVTYHSVHGAIQESQHIFIDAGLKEILKHKSDISIFEMGFGTGLNALLTLYEIHDKPDTIYYETVEQYPLEEFIPATLNYAAQMHAEHLQEKFIQMHASPWNKTIDIENNFSLLKRKDKIEDVLLDKLFDLVYFDAFAPAAQPELWTAPIFSKLYEAMRSGGLLLTYCSKGVVRRAMEEAGFIIEKLPGPKGKREIVRAIKN